MSRLDELHAIAIGLRDKNIRNLPLPIIKDRLREIVKDVPLPIVQYGESNTFVRSRICHSGRAFESLRELIYPPMPSSAFGRASVPGRHALYASFNKGTAMDEIGVTSGDRVQSMLFRPFEGQALSLVAIGEIQAAAANGKTRVCSSKLVERMDELLNSNREKFQEIIFVDSFLADTFSRENTQPYEYVVSAAFAEMAFEGGQCGILYPSVRRDQGWNLALTAEMFDSLCEVVAVQEELIRGVYGYGIYDSDVVQARYAETFLPDGTIVACANSESRVSWSLKGGVGYPRGQRGWRPNAA